MRILSLDVRNSGIEYGVFERRFLYVRELKRGFLRKEDSLDGLLKEIKKDLRPQGAVVGFSFNMFSHHFIKLPLMKEKEIRNAISFELEPMLPFPLEEYEFDYSVLSRKNNKLHLLVLAIKREHLMDMLNLLRENGLGIIGVRSSFIEIISGLAKEYRGRNIFLIEDGENLFISGTENSQVRFLSSRKVKKNEKFLIDPLFDDPVVQRYFLRPYQAESIPSSMKDYRILNYDPLRVLIRSLDGSILKDSVSMDFTPSDVRIPLMDYRPILTGVFAGLSILFFLITDLVGLYKERMALRKMSTLLEELKKEESLINESEEQRRILNDYLNGRKNAILALSRLSWLIKEDTVLTGFSIDIDNRIELEGNSSNSSEFFNNLDSSGFFTDIKYLGNIIVKEDREFFRISMVMKR